MQSIYLVLTLMQEKVFSSNSCMLSGNCVPPEAEQCMKRKHGSGFGPGYPGQKLPLKTFDSLVLSSKERTIKISISSKVS